MTKVTLKQFAADERRKACPVCRLPQDIYDQLRNRNRKAIHVDTAIAWLKSLGHEITAEQYMRHGRAGHEVSGYCLRTSAGKRFLKR